jgi:uncharacterized protein (DUF4415 family)
MRQEIARIKRGRVLGSGTKSSINIRLGNDILTAFKATGKGWQADPHRPCIARLAQGA